MTTELAGAIEIDPPLGMREIEALDLIGEDGAHGSMPWAVSRDGSVLRAPAATDVAIVVESLRFLVGNMGRSTRFRGTVAAYDPQVRELVAITASNGRVTVRTLRRSRGKPVANVIPMAGRRRSTSRAIG